MNAPHFHQSQCLPRQRAAALLAFAAAIAAVIPAVIPAAPARADGDRWPAPIALKAYTQECGACHTAFPAGMLPAASWQRVMNQLGRHYGADASLDATVAAPIAVWLQANTGTYKRAGEEPPQDRITRAAWFVRKHRKLEPEVWALPSVKTAANCAACHGSADLGIYSERSLRLPAGLDARQARAWHD